MSQARLWQYSQEQNSHFFPILVNLRLDIAFCPILGCVVLQSPTLAFGGWLTGYDSSDCPASLWCGVGSLRRGQADTGVWNDRNPAQSPELHSGPDAGIQRRSWDVCVMWDWPPAEAGVFGATLGHGSRV